MIYQKRPLISKKILGHEFLPEWALHLVLFLPSLFLVALKQSSMAAGLIAYLGCLFLYFLADYFLCPWRLDVNLLRRLIKLFVFVLGIVFFHGGVQFYLNSAFNAGKFYGGFVVFFFMLICAAGFSLRINALSRQVVSRWIERALWFMAFNAFIGLTGIQIFPQTTYKPVGLFSEPSHFALVLAPLLAYTCVVGARSCYWILGLFFVWGLAIQNLTTLLVVTLCALLVVRFSWHLLLIPLIFVLVAPFVDLDYFLSRMLISGDSENQSVLVLLQGWETALIMIERTSGWGGGFQQFGFIDAVGDIGEKIATGGDEGLNRFDGGSTASKISGEFGYLGEVLLFLYLVQFIRLFFVLRKACVSYDSGGVIFLKVCLFTFFIELFVRGVGYFSSTSFLALAAVVWFICIERVPGENR